MEQGLRVRERVGVADVVTLANLGVGFLAAIVALSDPGLAARLILLAAVADAIDGIVARRFGSTDLGPLLDSIADVVSFGSTPALFVYVASVAGWGGRGGASVPQLLVAVAVPVLFVACSVLRTGLYTVYVEEDQPRPGIPNTLAATILVAAYLSGFTSPTGLLLVAALVSPAMVAPFPLPSLRLRDAVVMGAVQAGAIAVPGAFGRALPRVLLVAATAYAVLGPRYYWDGSADGAATDR